MEKTVSPTLSVAALLAEREVTRRREREAEEQLKQKHKEELAAFRDRLENFKLNDQIIHAVYDKIRRAFERDESELMLTSFSSDFCSDSGRAVANAGAPPVNKPDPKNPAARPSEPEWLATPPAGARQIYDYWNQNLKPGGFVFSARIINYPGGKPGDISLFFSWPKSVIEAER